MTQIKSTLLEPYNTVTWLDYRHTGICNSEIFAALSRSDAFETPYSLWRRKTGLDAEDQLGSEAVRASIYLHEAVAYFFHNDSGCNDIPHFNIVAGKPYPNRVFRDDEHPCCLAAIVREYYDPSGDSSYQSPRGVLLCRTTQKTVDPDNLPEPWLLELQWQMRLANHKHGVIAWMGAGRQFGWREFDLDEAQADLLRAAVAEFWKTYVEGKTAPKPMNSADIQTMYAHAETGKRIEADDEILSKFTTLKALLPQLADLTAKKSALEDELKLFMGDAEAITHLGSILATWKAPKATLRFDAKAFQRAHPEEAKEYMVEQAATRRFLLK